MPQIVAGKMSRLIFSEGNEGHKKNLVTVESTI